MEKDLEYKVMKTESALLKVTTSESLVVLKQEGDVYQFASYKVNVGSCVDTGLVAKARGLETSQEMIAVVPMREPETLVHGHD